ncbi:anti-sigma factor family protein [Streptomyces sp. NPDC087294]|uniref:anti-sigma factor family protein n=1 Tax=Streptomyces sp. NPDC087294 TaxID=3365777 RepID=UPI003801057F
MTFTTDMTGHPDVDELSDLTEDLLPPSRTTEVRRHLDGCEPCADVYASLEEIRDLLGTAQAPPAMPADIVHRIDAALAAEALLSATASDGSPAHGELDAPAPVAESDDDSARVSRETTTAADRPSGRARTSTTGPGRKNRKHGGRRRVAVLGAVFTVAVLGLGSVLLTTLHDDKPSTSQAQPQATARDTFSSAKLETQVAALLKDQSTASSKAPKSMGIEGDHDQPKVLKQPTVPECVQNGIGRDDTALAAQEGTYQGGEALLVVLPDATDTTKVTAYLVDASCVDRPSSAPKAKVLLTETYARP